jgi:hypothetical protein
VFTENEWFDSNLASGEGPLLCHSGAPRPGEPGCGIIVGADARPNRREQREQENLTGAQGR